MVDLSTMRHLVEMSEETGSDLLLNNLDLITAELFKLTMRVTQIEKDIRNLRLDTDAHDFEISSIQTVCEQLAEEIVKLEEQFYAE